MIAWMKSECWKT